MTPGQRAVGARFRWVHAAVTLSTVAVVAGCAGPAPARSAGPVPTATVPSVSSEGAVAATVPVPTTTAGPALTPAAPAMGPDGPEWPNDVARVADALRAAYPDDYGMALVDMGAGTGTVRFEGEIPAGAAAIAAGIPQVRLVGGAGFSESDLTQATSTYLAAFDAAVSPARVLGAEADQETGRILVIIGPVLDPVVVPAPLTADELAAVRTAVLATDPLPLGLSLELEFAAEPRFGVEQPVTSASPGR